MFEDDDDRISPNEITFSYWEYDKHGTKVQVIRTLRGPETETLPNILREFSYFLNGLTFTYVDKIVAVKDDGRETSSEDY